jgi:hypothetical protein
MHAAAPTNSSLYVVYCIGHFQGPFCTAVAAPSVCHETGSMRSISGCLTLRFAIFRKMCREILVECISGNTPFLSRWFHSALSHASHLTNMSAFSRWGSAREILDSTSCVVHSYWTGRRVGHCPLLFRHQKHPLKTHKLLREHHFAYVFLGKCLPYVVFLSRLGTCWRTFSLLSNPFSCFERANSLNTRLNSHNSGSIHIVKRHAMLKQNGRLASQLHA